MSYFCIKEVLKYVVPRLPGTRRLLIRVVGKLKTLHVTNWKTLQLTLSKRMLVGKVFVHVGSAELGLCHGTPRLQLEWQNLQRGI
jgi:hypothetical protein